MTLRKDKKKVLGEVFDDDRIRSFLNYLPPAGVDRDFHLLEKAYRGMIPENFATFVQFFQEDGHDVNATNPEGKTLLAIVNTHRHGTPYAEALKSAGARE